LYLAGQITARYGQGREAEMVEVTLRNQQGEERNIQVKPLTAEQIPAAWFV
jgi:tRNA-uridine 2-sulfurtransferase